MKEFEDSWKRYDRLGHINEGRLCDELSMRAFDHFPGAILPKRWKWDSDFVDTYGDGFFWAITKSYHALFINGNYVFRIWTNADTPYAWVDLVGPLVVPLDMCVDVFDIPEGSRHKCRPMISRGKFIEKEQIDRLAQVVRSMYGLHQ